MYFHTMATKTREGRRRAVRVDASGSAVQVSEAPIVCTVEHFYTLRLTSINRAERDRLASLEFLHRLVVGPKTD